MSDWVEAELAECQMHDVRHTKRRGRLLGRLSEQPVGSIPTACHGWAETVAAYQQFPLTLCEFYATMVADSSESVLTIRFCLLKRRLGADMTGYLVGSRLTE